MSLPKVLICGRWSTHTACDIRELNAVANPQKGVIWVKEEQKSKLGAVAEVLVSLFSLSMRGTTADRAEDYDSPNREAFFADCKGKYDGVVGIYRHNDSAQTIGVFDKELIEALPSSVKYICHNGAGYDQSRLSTN